MKRLVVLLAVLAVGCGDDDADRPSPAAKPATVVLDFTPNPVHAPLYMAPASRLKIQKPGATPDSIKLVASGKVDLAVADIHDLAIAREAGTDVVAVGALVDAPLGALLAQPDIQRPRDLEGRTVGVSGLPSDPAFIRAIVEHDGGDFERIRQVTIGFNAVSRLLTKRVDAAPAFWNAEGVAVRQRGLDIREFRIDRYGAPKYPEVVLVTSRATLRAKRDDIRSALAAIADGIDATRGQRDEAIERIAEAAETTDTELVGAQLDAILPAFADGLRLDRATLEEWADFDERIGLVKERPDVEAAFDFTLAP